MKIDFRAPSGVLLILGAVHLDVGSGLLGFCIGIGGLLCVWGALDG